MVVKIVLAFDNIVQFSKLQQANKRVVYQRLLSLDSLGNSMIQHCR